jgi:hypothetical protein
METLLIQRIDGEKFCSIPVQEMVSFYSLTSGILLCLELHKYSEWVTVENVCVDMRMGCQIHSETDRLHVLTWVAL